MKQKMKRLSGFLLAALLLISGVCGFTFGTDSAQEYTGSWYGWYRITDATGEYADLKEVRRDCMVDVYSWHGDESISIFDEEHYELPFLKLNVSISGEAINAGDEGTLDGLELTSFEFSMKLPEEIRVENGTWIDAGLENEKGSIRMELFAMHMTSDSPDPFEVLKTDTGNLELTYEELMPEYYETAYLTAREQNSWVDIPTYFASLQPFEESDIHVDWAENCSFIGPVAFYRADYDSDFVQLAVRLDRTVYSVEVLCSEDAANSVLSTDVRTARKVSETARASDETPVLVLQLGKDRDLSQYGLRFSDYVGQEYVFTFGLEDGEPVLKQEAQSME